MPSPSPANNNNNSNNNSKSGSPVNTTNSTAPSSNTNNNNNNQVVALTTATASPPPATPATTTSSKLLLKLLSHDENGKETVILFDPEFGTDSSRMLSQSSSSSSANNGNNNNNTSSMIVNRVSSLTGGGARRTTAAASMLSGVEPQLVLPAASAITVFEFQQILVNQQQQQQQNNTTITTKDSASVASFSSSPSPAKKDKEPHHTSSSSSFTSIPVAHQLFRFEGQTIVDPTNKNNSLLIKKITVAEALMVAASSSGPHNNNQQLQQRTVHLYDAAFALRQQQKDRQVTLDVGHVLAAPRWVPPVYDHHNHHQSRQQSSSLAIEDNKQQQQYQNQAQSVPLVASANPSSYASVQRPTLSYQNSPSSRSPINNNTRGNNSNHHHNAEELLLTNTQSSPSANRIRDNVDDQNLSAARSAVIDAERLLEATVQQEVERLGTFATVDRIVSEEHRSPQVQRAMNLVERARATAQLQIQEHILKMKVEEETNSRGHLETIVQEQKRILALQSELQSLKEKEMDNKVRAALPGRIRGPDELARDNDFEYQREQAAARRDAAFIEHGLPPVDPPMLASSSLSNQTAMTSRPIIPTRRISAPEEVQELNKDMIHAVSYDNNNTNKLNNNNNNNNNRSISSYSSASAAASQQLMMQQQQKRRNISVPDHYHHQSQQQQQQELPLSLVAARNANERLVVDGHRDYVAQTIANRVIIDHAGHKNGQQREYQPLSGAQQKLENEHARLQEELQHLRELERLRRDGYVGEKLVHLSRQTGEDVRLERRNDLMISDRKQYHTAARNTAPLPLHPNHQNQEVIDMDNRNNNNDMSRRSNSRQTNNDYHHPVSQQRNNGSSSSIHSYSPGPATRHQQSNYVDRVVGAVKDSMGRN